jgi:hypothetical protein
MIEKMIHITLKFDVPVKVCEEVARPACPLSSRPEDHYDIIESEDIIRDTAISTVEELIQSWRTNGLYGDPPVPADLPPPPLPPSLLAAAVVERVTVTGPTDYEECLACQ